MSNMSCRYDMHLFFFFFFVVNIVPNLIYLDVFGLVLLHIMNDA
jgi:hypothetical protein